ncbi:glycine betaine transport system permease protein OpuAB [Arthrobacter sp. Hiyo8]|nr:glycine betaine transport system permease protein OpuAB [Arthrobacter sp. Hiyo8]
MSTLVRDRAPVQASANTLRPPRKRLSRRVLLLGAAGVLWLLGFLFLHGTSTLTLPASELTDLHRSLNQFNAWVASNRADNPVFQYVFTPFRSAVDSVANLFTSTFAASSTGLRLPEIGWLGTVGLLSWIAFAVGNARVGLLTAAAFTFFGLQGLFTEAAYTFALVLTAVLFSLLIGIPLGVLAGISGRVSQVITPVLDFMQILPTFVYLAPLALIFLIGPASAVIATVIYAVPPLIRLTAHGIRNIPENTREASDSLGTTGLQRLLTLQLPLARRTIVMGINQSTMAALSMVTIAALIAAPAWDKWLCVPCNRSTSGQLSTQVCRSSSWPLCWTGSPRPPAAGRTRSSPQAPDIAERQVHPARCQPRRCPCHGPAFPDHALGSSLSEEPQLWPGHRQRSQRCQRMAADKSFPVYGVVPRGPDQRNP